MTEHKATRSATAANHPSTLRPSDQQWQHHLRSDTPSSSSAQTNDRLTPDDSDSPADDEEIKAGLRRYHEAARAYGGTSSKPAAAAHSAESGLDDAGYKSDDDGDEERARGVRRGSSSTVDSFRLYTPDEERAVVRKLDRRLVLFMALLYMLSFLDRSSMQSLCRWPCYFHDHFTFLNFPSVALGDISNPARTNADP